MAIPNRLESLTAAAGILPSTMERTLRVLRPAGMVPLGARGLGNGSPWLPVHLANLLLSLAAPEPSAAAAFATAFGDFRFVTSFDTLVDVPGVPKPRAGNGTLREVLIAMIEGVTPSPKRIDFFMSPRRLPEGTGFPMSARRADLVWRQEQDDEPADAYGCSTWPKAVSLRVSVPGVLVSIAADICHAASSSTAR